MDGNGHKFGDNTNQSYILSRGAFHIDQNWLLGFTAERVSNQLLFDAYDIPKVYESRGPYVADDRRLISQVYAIREDSQSYFSAAAMSIQGLRPSNTVPGQFEDSATFPTVAPLVEERFNDLVIPSMSDSTAAEAPALDEPVSFAIFAISSCLFMKSPSELRAVRAVV